MYVRKMQSLSFFPPSLSPSSSYSFWPLLLQSPFLLTCHVLYLDVIENMIICLCVWFILLDVLISRFIPFLHIDIILLCGVLYACTPFSLSFVCLWTSSLLYISAIVCLRKSYSIETALVYISATSA